MENSDNNKLIDEMAAEHLLTQHYYISHYPYNGHKEEFPHPKNLDKE